MRRRSRISEPVARRFASRRQSLDARASSLVAMLELRNINKTYLAGGSEQVTAVKDVAFRVERGQCVALVGPSGCGKTTLLTTVAGLAPPTGGKVLVNNREVDGPPREMVMVFQDYANSLFPWRTVLGNVLFALEGRRESGQRKRHAAMDALQSVGLAEFSRHYPWQLSGGMQQRAAIARSLAYGSEILLMDEPFASVDAQTRETLEDLLLGVWERFNKTILFVTHDIDEAVYLSDKVVVLTKRPARVAETVDIDLPRPRTQVATRSAPRFIELRNHIHGLLASGARSGG